MARGRMLRTNARHWQGALVAGLLLTAGTAQAQEAPSDNEIVVRGEAELETDEVADAVRDIAMRGRSKDRPLARYQAPLCPRVMGMGDRMGDYVSERIRRNALDVGLAVDADENCTANALLIVTDDPDRLIERMREENPRLFNPRISREIKAAQNRGDGAIVWSTYAMQGPQGRGKASGTVFANTLESAFMMGGVVQEMRLTFPSQAQVPYSIDKTSTILVFDVDRLDGMHLDQLSDFATLRILGRPQPEIAIEEDGALSILNLFDVGPKSAPMAMTVLDRAYLRGLYAMWPNDPQTRLERYVKLAYDDLRGTFAEADAQGLEPGCGVSEAVHGAAAARADNAPNWVGACAAKQALP